MEPPPPSGAWARPRTKSLPPRKFEKSYRADSDKTDGSATPPDEIALLAKAVESLRQGGYIEILALAEEKLEAARSAKLLGRPVSQQCRRLEQQLDKKQKALDKTLKVIEDRKDQIKQFQEDIKEAEAFATKLDVEMEGLAKEISLVPRSDRPSACNLVQGADLVPALFKEGEVWKKAQATLDEALKAMHDIVEGAKLEAEIAAPSTPQASPRADLQEVQEVSDDVDMDETCDVEDQTKAGDIFADAALGISDDVRKELKRKTIEFMDGVLKSRKHLLKSRKARASAG